MYFEYDPKDIIQRADHLKLVDADYIIEEEEE